MALLNATKVPPAVNQCEMSTDHLDKRTIDFCEKHKITYEAYGVMKGCNLEDHTLKSIADAIGVDVPQVCIRWVLEHNAILTVGTGTDKVRGARKRCCSVLCSFRDLDTAVALCHSRPSSKAPFHLPPSHRATLLFARRILQSS